MKVLDGTRIAKEISDRTNACMDLSNIRYFVKNPDDFLNILHGRDPRDILKYLNEYGRYYSEKAGMTLESYYFNRS